MPKQARFTPEFRDQCISLVFAECGPDESRKAACTRLGPAVNVKPVTLYNWVKAGGGTPTRPDAAPGSVEELRA
jgi:transposase-like protein